MRLSRLTVGEKAILSPHNSTNELFLKLTDMGASPYSPIECLFKNFSGNMKAYSIGNSVIALRNADADYIEVFL